MIDQERFQNRCRELRRELRNDTKNCIYISSEHRLDKDQILQAGELAQSIESLRDPEIILERFKREHKADDYLRIISLQNAIGSLTIEGIKRLVGYYSEFDRVHKIVHDAAMTSANVTGVNCSLKFMNLPNDDISEYFIHDQTEKFSEIDLSGKSVRTVCIEPRLGKLWVKAQTQALKTYDPAIKTIYEL